MTGTRGGDAVAVPSAPELTCSALIVVPGFAIFGVTLALVPVAALIFLAVVAFFSGDACIGTRSAALYSQLALKTAEDPHNTREKLTHPFERVDLGIVDEFRGILNL